MTPNDSISPIPEMGDNPAYAYIQLVANFRCIHFYIPRKKRHLAVLDESDLVECNTIGTVTIPILDWLDGKAVATCPKCKSRLHQDELILPPKYVSVVKAVINLTRRNGDNPTLPQHSLTTARGRDE